jgi:hypothetical protein
MEKELRKDEKNKICLQTADNSFIVYELEKEDWVKLKVFPRYDEAEDYLDKRIDRKAKGTLIKKKPLPAILREGGWNSNGYAKTNITSIECTGSYVQCWNTNEKKKRCKESVSAFLKDTERNWEILKEIEEKESQIRVLKEEQERFSNEELKEYFQDI